MRNWFLLLFVTFLLATYFATVTCQTPGLASYGEACGNGTRCNARDSLICLDHICKCLLQYKMVYSAEQSKCVVLSGERCYFTPWGMDTEQPDAAQYREKLSCVDNAVCGSDGFCNCSSSYYETKYGSCFPKRLRGDNCNGNQECRADQGLACVEGTCACNKAEAVYSPEISKCVGLVGQTCQFNDSDFSQNSYDSFRLPGKFEACVEHAECRYKSNGDIQDPNDWLNRNAHQYCICEEGFSVSDDGHCYGSFNQTCDDKTQCLKPFTCLEGRCLCPFPSEQEYNFLTKRCECEKKYLTADDGTCQVKYWGTCRDDFPCATGLKCFRGKCDCPYFLYQYYDYSTKSCVSLPRAPCLETVGGSTLSFNCVKNAECVMADGRTSGECRCKKGFIESGNRTCKITEGYSCQDDPFGCDLVAGLHCVDKICTCGNLRVYCKRREQCRSLVGGLCDVRALSDDAQCIDGATCVMFRGRTSLYGPIYPNEIKKTPLEFPFIPLGVCRCNSSSEVTPSRKCVPKNSYILSDHSLSWIE